MKIIINFRSMTDCKFISKKRQLSEVMLMLISYIDIWIIHVILNGKINFGQY